MISRLFIDQNFHEEEIITLPKEELHHLKVLRARVGDTIELINGRGFLATATYASSKTLTIDAVVFEEPPLHESIIVQGLADSSHLDFLIEKGCEIGVTQFILFPSQKSRLKKVSEAKESRLGKLLISALKQSKRLYLPRILIVDSLDHIPLLPAITYLADPTGSRLTSTPEQSCAFIIGPESGLTEEEIAYFTQERKAEKVCLSSHTLRTETASILSAFLLTQKLGQL